MVTQLLAPNVTIKTLRLDNNEVEDEGAEWIAAMLLHNKGIETLSITGTGFHRKCAELFYDTSGHPALGKMEENNNGKARSGKHQVLQEAGKFVRKGEDALAYVFHWRHQRTTITTTTTTTSILSVDVIADVSNSKAAVSGNLTLRSLS